MKFLLISLVQRQLVKSKEGGRNKPEEPDFSGFCCFSFSIWKVAVSPWGIKEGETEVTVP